jgi:hypothetical protein
MKIPTLHRHPQRHAAPPDKTWRRQVWVIALRVFLVLTFLLGLMAWVAVVVAIV